MTRKRRISEAVVACNVRDPLNLRSGAAECDTYELNSSSSIKVSHIEKASGDFGGESSQNSVKHDEVKINHESVNHQKSLPSFSTPPRLIRPLLARNPKDPLDLLNSGQPDRSTISISRSQKVPSPVCSQITDQSFNTKTVVCEVIAKIVSSRKRKRNRSTINSEVDNQRATSAIGNSSPSSNKLLVGTEPTLSSTEPCTSVKNVKKPRRSNKRKRKRRHGKCKKSENSVSAVLQQPPTTEEQAVTSKNKPPPNIGFSPLIAICSSIRFVFAKSKVLYIGSCGDNGSLAMQIVSQMGADSVMGVDQCLKRIRIARRSLAALAGQVSLEEKEVTESSTTYRFPRSFHKCFGPVGPDVNSDKAGAVLRSIEFSHVSDYANISPKVIAEESHLVLWDTVIIQESVISSILCNPVRGPNGVHVLLSRISESLRPGGHIVLIMGRLRWQRQLKSTSRSLLESSHPIVQPCDRQQRLKPDDEPNLETEIPAAAQMHPLTQLRKYFRFRLVRRITSPVSQSRLRRPSSVSWRGTSPFHHRHRHHSHHHLVRPQSLLSTTSSYLHGWSGDYGRNPRKLGGFHRVVFALQKKATSDKLTPSEKPTSSSI